MGNLDGLVKERVKFLSQEPERLRGLRGRELHESLGQLELTHSQYFRALGTNVQDYCAQEFGIDVSKVTVERFFQSDPSAKWLFPDIVREAVLTGIRRRPAYGSLIAADEAVPGTAYDLPYVVENAEEEEPRMVAEGAVIPESELTYGNRVVRLRKLGRGVIASYEAIRRMSVNLLRVHLVRIGEQMGQQLDAALAGTLISGEQADGSDAAVPIHTATSNAWVYGDIVGGFLELAVARGFTPTHMLADTALCKTILGMTEFKDSVLFDFAKTGNLPSPLGVKLVPMAYQPPKTLTILDANYAAVKLTEQDVLVESDKLINQQWERTYLTTVTAFALLYPQARVVVSSDWT